MAAKSGSILRDAACLVGIWGSALALGAAIYLGIGKLIWWLVG